MAEDATTTTVTVPGSPEQALAVFFDRFAEWWPREFSWSQDVLESVALDARPGGRASEYGPDGFRIDWGTLREVDRPRRALFTWQISPRREPVPDPGRASEVEVRFERVEDGRTRVAVEHRAFRRHGEGAGDYRRMMAEQGWPFALDRYARLLERDGALS
ncbi:ATPase [Geodermatophilus sp. DF01-2]|uniref:SRPBCC family protein n=1 Tax=Geodermatophilus sp. DF01-2 TaxID=2559610 RepID=UPI001073A075|nr:SRPBCC family protein [Geodermatophilus sp. DF01_2]TFV63790.1 ATPase [Geodermatophilus sp. DF01_2]